MSARVPRVGDTVLYKLNEQDEAVILADRASRHHLKRGNTATKGQVYPMVIVRVWGTTADSSVNGQVLLDGPGSHWVTSRHLGDGEGEFAWPVPY